MGSLRSPGASDHESRTPTTPAPLRRVLRVLLSLLPAGLIGGCHAPPSPAIEAPQAIHIEGGEYLHAFEASLRAARTHGYEASIRDIRAGVIETEARRTSTIGEPWRADGTSIRARLAATFQHEHRRLRFEFTAASTSEPLDDPTQAGVPGVDLPGADVLALEIMPPDLTRWSGDLELRVWAWIERPHTFGRRSHPWSRTFARRGGQGGFLESPWAWEAARRNELPAGLPMQVVDIVGRDAALEASMRRAIARSLAKAVSSAPSTE